MKESKSVHRRYVKIHIYIFELLALLQIALFPCNIHAGEEKRFVLESRTFEIQSMDEFDTSEENMVDSFAFGEKELGEFAIL